MASRDDRRRTNERNDNGERDGWNLAAYSRRSSKVRSCQCRRDRSSNYSRDSSSRRALRRDRRDESGRSSRGGNNGLSKFSKNQRLYKNRNSSSNRVSFKQSSLNQSRNSSSRSGSRRSSRASSSKRLYRRRTTAAARRLEAALKKKAAENQGRRNRRARRVSYAAATSNENVSGNEIPNNAAIAPPVRSDGLPPRPPRDAAPVQRSERRVNNSAPPPPSFANCEAPLGPVIRGFQSVARHPRGKFYGNTPQPDSDDETEEERIRRLSKAYQALRQQGYLQKCLEQPVQINFGETDAEIPDITTDGQEQDDKKYSDTHDWGPIPPVRTDFSHLVTAGPYKKSAAASKNNEYPSKGISAHWQEQHPKWKDSRYHIDKPYPCTCELCQSPPKKFNNTVCKCMY